MKNLYTERLILRSWLESDYKDLYEYAKSDLVGPNAGWPPHKNEDDSKKIVKKFINDDEVYAIELKSENKVIGSIGLHSRITDESYPKLLQRELGYVLNPKYWGQGIMPEAVKCLLDYGFSELFLDLIWCRHYDFNHNSRRVIEKCGFKYRYTKKDILLLLDNKEVHALYYNIFRNEYK